MRTHTQPHLTFSPPGPVSILAPDAEKEGGGRGILTHVSLSDVFHPDDPHCQQVAWRQLLLWIERTVDSLFGRSWQVALTEKAAQAPTAQAQVTSPLSIGVSGLWRMLLGPRGPEAVDVRGFVLTPL